jgi:hypothetical protein
VVFFLLINKQQQQNTNEESTAIKKNENSSNFGIAPVHLRKNSFLTMVFFVCGSGGGVLMKEKSNKQSFKKKNERERREKRAIRIVKTTLAFSCQERLDLQNDRVDKKKNKTQKSTFYTHNKTHCTIAFSELCCHQSQSEKCTRVKRERKSVCVVRECVLRNF